MTAVMPSPVVLPRAATLTDTLLAPAAQAVAEPHRAVLRERLRRELAGTVPGPGDGRLRIDGYLVRTTCHAAPRAPEPGPFEWSARGARRTLGLAALRLCLTDHQAPATAVPAVMRAMLRGDPDGHDRPGSLGRWLSTLSSGARNAVLVEAVTWATSLHGSLAWQRVGHHAEIGGRDRWWDCPSAPGIGIRGRAEVRVPVPARGAPVGTGGTVTEPDAGLALFSVMSGWPGPSSRSELGVTALAHALLPGSPAPVRVVGWWPQTGRALALPVDRVLLDQAADTVLGVAWAVLGPRGAPPAA